MSDWGVLVLVALRTHCMGVCTRGCENGVGVWVFDTVLLQAEHQSKGESPVGIMHCQ